MAPSHSWRMTRKNSGSDRRSGDNPARPTAVATVRGPADVAAMVPYLLGFQPHDSLVVVALDGPRKQFGPVLRVDLVEDDGLVQQQAAQVLHVITSNRLAPVLVAAFSASAHRADPLVSLVLAELAGLHVAVEDAFRADGSRWWSYVCVDPLCCSPTGVPYDVRASAAAAEAVLAGLSFESDRDGLRAHVAPASESERDQVAQEVRRLGGTTVGRVRQPGRRGLAGRVAELLPDPSAATSHDVAWLGLAVQSQQGRDEAMALIDRSNAADNYGLWRHVMCRVGDDLLPQVGCLAAFAAWLDGRGVLSSHVVDRVLEVDPDHRLAGTLAQVLAHAVDPRSFPPRLAG